MIAFEIAAAAKISPDAQTVRYCCRLLWAMVAGIRYAVMAMSMPDKLKRSTSETLRFQ
jgi:hypothetical protein